MGGDFVKRPSARSQQDEKGAGAAVRDVGAGRSLTKVGVGQCFMWERQIPPYSYRTHVEG